MLIRPSLRVHRPFGRILQSQLRSLSSGLDAHGGGAEEAVRGGGWDGWREEGGALSPEGTQVRDTLDGYDLRVCTYPSPRSPRTPSDVAVC